MGQHRVERRHRLVGQDQLRVLHQRASDAHALLLPAGERIRAHVLLALQVDLVQAGQRLRAVRLENRCSELDSVFT